MRMRNIKLLFCIALSLCITACSACPAGESGAPLIDSVEVKSTDHEVKVDVSPALQSTTGEVAIVDSSTSTAG